MSNVKVHPAGISKKYKILNECKEKQDKKKC